MAGAKMLHRQNVRERTALADAAAYRLWRVYLAGRDNVYQVLAGLGHYPSRLPLRCDDLYEENVGQIRLRHKHAVMESVL